MIQIDWDLSIEIKSEANLREHWLKSGKRHHAQKTAIWLKWINEKPNIDLPCRITLIRYGIRLLDDDNLVSGFKWVRDAIASLILPGLAIGQADGDERLKWAYKQEKSKEKKIKIIIESL